MKAAFQLFFASMMILATIPLASLAEPGKTAPKSTWKTADWIGQFVGTCKYVAVSEGETNVIPLPVGVTVTEAGTSECAWISGFASYFLFCGRPEKEKQGTAGGYNVIRKGLIKNVNGFFYNLDFKRNIFQTAEKYRVQYVLNDENTLSLSYTNRSDDGSVASFQCLLRRK